MWRPERWIATLLTMPAIRSSALRCASVALAAILLTGCTSEAAPAPTAPATTAATPAVSPSPSPAVAAPSEPAIEKITTPPRVPADLTTPGKVGSKAAVEYFVALHPYIVNTGDVEPLRGLASPACDYCNQLIAGVEKDLAAGWTTSGDVITIDDLWLSAGESTEHSHFWIVDVRSSGATKTGPDGAQSRIPGKQSSRGLHVTWTGDRWQVSRVRAVEYVE